MDDVTGGRKFDAVVSIVPFGLKLPRENQFDTRWTYVPPKTSAEVAWVQIALSALKPDGVAILLLPNSLAFKTAAEPLRRELVRRGLLRAVLGLPEGALAATRIATDIWILNGPGTAATDNVVFGDLSDRAPAGTNVYSDVPTKLANPDEQGYGFDIISVPVLEVIGGDVNVNPRWWSAFGENTDDPNALNSSAAVAFDGLESVFASLHGIRPPAMTLNRLEVPVVTLKDLRDQGVIEIIRPRSQRAASKAKSGQEDPEETHKLGVKEAEAIRAGELGGPRTDTETDPARTTRPGDVVVWISGTRRQVKATVCKYAGYTPVGLVQIIRCNKIDPEYLALCIESESNTALVTGQYVPHVSALNMQLPLAPMAPQRDAAALGKALTQLEVLAAELQTVIANSRAALAAALASGQLVVETASDVPIPAKFVDPLAALFEDDE
jgi:hypothetical protein